MASRRYAATSARSGLARPLAATFDDLIDEAIESGLVTIGTPGPLIEVIRSLAKQTGRFGTFIVTLTGFTDFAAG